MRVWGLTEGFPCLARIQVGGSRGACSDTCLVIEASSCLHACSGSTVLMPTAPLPTIPSLPTQVADLRGSTKALAVADNVLYVGGQSCQVAAYRLTELQADAGRVAEGCASGVLPSLPADPQDDLGTPKGAPCGPASGFPGSEKRVQACGGPSVETIRCMVGQAQPPAFVSTPEHSHCGSITALAVCGPYVFSASTDSTVRVWKRDTLEFVRVLRGHRGSVLALWAGPGIMLRCAVPADGLCLAWGWL